MVFPKEEQIEKHADDKKKQQQQHEIKSQHRSRFSFMEAHNYPIARVGRGWGRVVGR